MENEQPEDQGSCPSSKANDNTTFGFTRSNTFKKNSLSKYTTKA